ncbi:MAG: DUF1080 domain-containing protein [Bacteroidales bacterium]|nr:DUF1080 domain-containing protein [Bacteroidales bacterium]
MKRIVTIFLLGMLLVSSSLTAQDVRLLQTKVADILNQVPAHDLKQRDRVVEEMLALGESGLMEFTKMVVPPGTGDDTRVRYALNGLALYVGREGKDRERQLVSGVFIKALDQATDPLVKSFYLYHLKFFGHEEVVPAIAAYLNDPKLCDYAAQALVGLNNHAAQHALKTALAEVDAPCKLKIVKALGVYASPCAEAEIRKLAASDDPQMRKIALWALAKIGSPESAEFMIRTARDVKFTTDPSGAMRSLVSYTDHLAANGEINRARRIAYMIVKECTREDNYTYGLSGMSLLTDHFGYEALHVLLKAMDDPRPDYRAGALRYARQINDIAAIRQWMKKAKESDPRVAAEIIDFLGEMQNPVAIPDIKASLKDQSPVVRSAAMDAYVKLLGKKALSSVLDFLKQGQGAEIVHAEQLLLPLCGLKEVPAIATALDQMPDQGKPVLIGIIAARRATGQFNRILALTSNEDPEVSDAAFKALPAVSSREKLDQLIQLLDQTGEESHIAAVQQALVQAANGIKSPGERSAPFLKAYNENKKIRPKILGVLPRIGGTQSLNLVGDVFNHQRRALKEQAFKALTQWKNPAAATQLYNIVSKGSKKYKKEAFAAYVRLIQKASITPEQKLLRLRKIMLKADDPGMKEQVLKALEPVKIFPALVYVAHFLDDANPEVQSSAAWTASKIALPPSGTRNGMYGSLVRKILNKCIPVISGRDSQYAKENIRNWLHAMPEAEGFVSMFNGKDLSGWQGLVKNPIARAKMTPEELARQQKEADALVPENWSVANGEIRFTGKGYKNLCSVKKYGDFELWVDWRITKGGDSGIYLRGTPQVQIWDTSRIEVGAQVGSGGLYNNQKHPSKPAKVADNQVGEWNTFFIRMIGDRVTVELNGERVVDNVILENYWDRTLPIFPSGPIELQAHGTNLAFRDIYVKEIHSETYNLTPEEQADGFVALFNGKNLDGWVGNKTDYSVKDGVIVIEPKGGGHGNLYTEKEYGNFAFRFEFQLTPGANNGIGIRAPLKGDAAYVGMEIQVLDNTAPIYAHLQPYQYHGSVYGVIPARRGFLKPVGEWNEEEIFVRGNHVKVTLNGTVIVDGDIHEASKNGTMDHNQHPGLKRTTGHIGFLGHGSVVRFRNIRVRVL